MELRDVFKKQAKVHVLERQETKPPFGEGRAHKIPSNFAFPARNRILTSPKKGSTTFFDLLQCSGGEQEDTHSIDGEGAKNRANQNSPTS